MKNYKKVLEALSVSQGIRTVGTKLSKVEFESSDATLKKHLSACVSAIETQIARGVPVSQPTRLINASDQRFVDLRDYCLRRTKSEKPEWMITAEKNGWTPPEQE